MNQNRTPAPQWTFHEGFVSLTRPSKPPRPVRIGARPLDVEIDLARSALVAIDLQNDFLHPDGWMGQYGLDLSAFPHLTDNINALTRRLRTAGVPVLWVNFGVRPDLLDVPPVQRVWGRARGSTLGIGSKHPTRDYRILVRGEWGSDVCTQLLRSPDDVLVYKSRMSGFWGTELEAILRNLDTRTLLFAGVNTDRCVSATVHDASYLGFDCILVEDCTGTISAPPAHELACRMIENLSGFVTTSVAIAAALTGSGASTGRGD